MELRMELQRTDFKDERNFAFLLYQQLKEKFNCNCTVCLYFTGSQNQRALFVLSPLNLTKYSSYFSPKYSLNILFFDTSCPSSRFSVNNFNVSTAPLSSNFR